MMGVWSNCRIRWHAETPSKFGMMMSMRIRSYFDPAFILLTASRPSNYHRQCQAPLRLQWATYRAVDGTMDRIQKSRSNPPTRRIIFDQQDLRRSDPAGINLRTFLPPVRGSFPGIDDFLILGWHGVWNIMDMLAIHRVDPVGLPHRVDDGIRLRVQLRIRHRRVGPRGRRRSGMATPRFGIGRWGGHGPIGTIVHVGHVFQIFVVELHIRVQPVQELGRILERRGRFVRQWRDGLSRGVPIARRYASIIPGWSHFAVASVPGIYRMQEVHHVLHHMLMIDHRLLQADELLYQHSLVYVHFIISLLEMRQLLLRRHQLRVHQIDLLGGQRFFRDLGWFPGRGSFAANIIQRIFVVGFEFRVFELPCLRRSVGFSPPEVFMRLVAMSTHPEPVRGLPAFFVVVADLVKVVFVELAHEAGEIAVLEMLGQDGFGEPLILQGHISQWSWFGDCHEPRERTSSTTKLSRSSPHRTMDE